MDWLNKIKQSGNKQEIQENRFRSLISKVENIIPIMEEFKVTFQESGLNVVSYASTRDVSLRWINLDQRCYILSVGSVDISGNIEIIIREFIIYVTCKAHYSSKIFTYYENNILEKEQAIRWLKFITRNPTFSDKWSRFSEKYL